MRKSMPDIRIAYLLVSRRLSDVVGCGCGRPSAFSRGGERRAVRGEREPRPRHDLQGAKPQQGQEAGPTVPAERQGGPAPADPPRNGTALACLARDGRGLIPRMRAPPDLRNAKP